MSEWCNIIMRDAELMSDPEWDKFKCLTLSGANSEWANTICSTREYSVGIINTIASRMECERSGNEMLV